MTEQLFYTLVTAEESQRTTVPIRSRHTSLDMASREAMDPSSPYGVIVSTNTYGVNFGVVH